MERYSDGSPVGETGLEEPMWQLSLGGGSESYPERPDEADCIYYLRNGSCGYGSRCRFNHPPDRSVAMRALKATGGEHPERVGQPLCQYYMRNRMCKFGASCKYHHPREGGGSPHNIYGYPLRPGEKECLFYMKTGHCKFGITCKFHHPQSAGAQVPASAAGPGPFPSPAAVPPQATYPALRSPIQSAQQYEVVAGDLPAVRPTLLPASYFPGTYGTMLFPPGMVPAPGWTPYLASACPVPSMSTQSAAGAGPPYGLTQLSASAPAYMGPYMSFTPSAGPSGNILPERPGQPECQNYMKYGDCKFGSSCRYHHPPALSGPKAGFILSAMGLPLRPGAPICYHYAQNGVCKFGPSCKFDHPMGISYSPSASSLADMPVAPYPVGSSMGTLAPSSSSSDLRPELVSGSSKDAFTTHTYSVSVSSGSAGSMLSKGGPVSHGSSGTGHEGEAHT